MAAVNTSLQVIIYALDACLRVPLRAALSPQWFLQPYTQALTLHTDVC